MKAVAFHRSLPIDDAQALVDLELPDPEPRLRDLVVEVRAISVNPVDYKVRLRHDPAQYEPRVLGWDAAGIVKSTGADARLFKPGDEVYYAGSIHRPGANSEYHLVDERIVGHKPRTLDYAAAAALPLTALTAWECLFDRMGLDPAGGGSSERTLLIIGGAGGVGSIAIQLAKRLAGIRVIATASRRESVRWVRDLGADATIDHNGDLAAQLQALGTPEVDYILCLADATPYFTRLAPIIKPQGKIALVVSMALPVDLTLFMQKSVTIAWEYMFTRSLFETPDMEAQHRILEQLAELIDAGTLKTTLGERLGLINAENLKRAHAMLESGRAIGKIVLEGW